MAFKYFLGLTVLNSVFWQVSFGIPLQPHWGLSITLIVPAGKEDCYFLSNIQRKKTTSIEFRVTNTKSVWAGRNVMIAFHVFDPKGGKVASVDRSVARSYFFTANFDGDYKICVDNRISSPGKKDVYLQVEVANTLKRFKNF